ncbi:MAG: mucoidy inhibitor MuiA family protein [Paludibacteraceae bacterium]|nr:mucoidy inhibitor MuiA family protein [Paludibacteraceae bacterium]
MKAQYIIKSILAGCISLCCLSTFAAQEATSKITDVMVYPQGAMVSRVANVNVKPGQSEVKIPLITPLLDKKSIQVGIKRGDVTLVSVDYDVEVPNSKQITKEANALNKRAGILRDSIDMLKEKNSVLRNERELILKSNNIGGENGFTATTLQGIASYVRKDLNEIASLEYKNQKKIEQLQKELTSNEQKVNLLYDKQIEPKSFLKLTLSARMGTNCDINIQYFVRNASWMPFYETRITKADKHLHLIQKAYVSQGSKENWGNVKLSLSQNDPTVSNEKPELKKHFIPNGYNDYRRTNSMPSDEKEYIKVLGIVRDKENPLKGVLISCGEDIKTETDENGYYELLVPIYARVKYEFVGYQTFTTSAEGQNVAVRNVELGPYSKLSNTIESNLFMDYASQNKIQINKSKSQSSDMEANIPQMVIRNYISDIAGKNTIPDDAADHEIVVKDMSINAEYNFFAVPKISKDVYLVASIPDWKKLDLLDGKVKLFLNNMYMGESFINTRQTEDTLHLSIGKDRDLAVDRKELKNYSSKNLTKTTDKTEKIWQITVKNNKAESVKITVEDQYPISTTDEIKVELTESSGAEVDPIEGKLTWKLTLKPGEKKELKFSYTVKSKTEVFVE